MISSEKLKIMDANVINIRVSIKQLEILLQDARIIGPNNKIVSLDLENRETVLVHTSEIPSSILVTSLLELNLPDRTNKIIERDTGKKLEDVLVSDILRMPVLEYERDLWQEGRTEVNEKLEKLARSNGYEGKIQVGMY